MQWSADSKESAFQCRGGRQESDALQAARLGMVRHGLTRPGSAVLGAARRGQVRLGEARQGVYDQWRIL